MKSKITLRIDASTSKETFYNLEKGSFMSVYRKTLKGGRFQYRGVEDNTLYGSGMTPEQFSKRFWFDSVEFVKESK